MNFHIRLEIDVHYYFHVNWGLLEDFEIFDNFDRIFLPYFWAFFDPLKWVQVFDLPNTAK